MNERNQQNLSNFIKVLRSWLRLNDLDGDLSLVQPEIFRDRGWDISTDVILVLTTEGRLHFLLNYNPNHPKLAEFSDICRSFGYCHERHHSWSMCFYKLSDGDPEDLRNRSYSSLRGDRRWREKAGMVKKRAEGLCEDCGARRPLEAHHCWYMMGLAPWQYPLDSLRALCRGCHEGRHPQEMLMRGMLARLTREEIDTVIRGLDDLFHWYDRKSALAFMRALGELGESLVEAAKLLAQNRTEPGAD